MSEARIDRLDEDIRGIKATLARLEPIVIRIDATLPHLATKAELATGLAEVTIALADKPSRGYMWLVVGTLIVAYAAGLAVLRLVIQ
jgi:hypothetical protein